MKSVKPGRGPSLMEGTMSILVGVFGVLWTIAAYAMGAVMMVPFGVIFIVIAIVQACYSFHNATGKRRFSSFDITDDGEEPDPLNAAFGGQAPGRDEGSGGDAWTADRFCPYCGERAGTDHVFCSRCGRKLPPRTE
ncbi:MAG: zinc ribbon domain-containing protein [Clostridia bacterium]|nr:zinc ribbon domain-containing protein [Clostridia bacterium]